MADGQEGSPKIKPSSNPCSQRRFSSADSWASFRYRKEHSPLLGEILRPIAPIQVKSRVGKWFPALMYVDSGADITLVPRDFGRLLGLDLAEKPGDHHRCDRRLPSSVPSRCGSSNSRLSRHIQDCGVRKNDVPYLLGRNGVSRAFTVIFQEYRSLVRFDPVS